MRHVCCFAFVVAMLSPMILGDGAFSAAGRMPPPLFSNDPRTYTIKEASRQYNEEAKAGVLSRKKGDLNGAIVNFSAAANENIVEFPNYLLWPDLSDLYCRVGKKRQGLILLAEYKCAVEVMAGHKQCWSDTDNSLRLPKPGISPLCYTTMCDEVYEDLFWQGKSNPQLQIKYRNRLTLASRIEAECRK